MLRFVLRRLATIPVSLLIVLALTFVVLRSTGDPVQLYLGIDATPAQIALLRVRLHLDQSLAVQFLIFLGDAVRGDFGRSLQYAGPAMPIVLQRLGMTLELVAVALVIAVVAGVGGGVWAAVRRDRPSDFVLSGLAVIGQSMPSFWLGILLVQLFALKLGWLPTSGTGWLSHLVLPAITLAAFLLPNFVLITRANMIDIADELFVTVARAKGLRERTVVLRHVLRNAINPVLSFLGLQMGRLVGGSILTETIFAWPGIGRLMIGSIFQRDLPIVVSGVIVVSIGIALANLLVDLLLSVADPRIRLE
jgi:peptide/nickel transport system permease protein/glutathione transport system permease protein